MDPEHEERIRSDWAKAPNSSNTKSENSIIKKNEEVEKVF